MANYLLLIPFGVLLLGVIWAMFGDKLPGGDRGTVLLGALSAFGAALGFALVDTSGGALFGGRLANAPDARFVTIGITVLTGIWLLWLAGKKDIRAREAVALSLLSAMGSSLMVLAYDFIVMVLAIELATMPVYVLIGYKRRNLKSLEGAVKYFLLSVLASLIMAYGITFLVGMSGTSSFAGLDLSSGSLLQLSAVLLLFVGVFAKISATPFHYWAPDAYEGAEPWIVAFASSVPKLAGFVLAIRVLFVIAGSSPEGLGSSVYNTAGLIIYIVSVASMTLGSFAALRQDDVRRLMAYSGVVNAGYVLVPLAFARSFINSALLFAVFYAIATMGVLLVLASEGTKLSDLAGLSKRKPLAAWALAIFSFSMIGVPPLAGFFGKFYIFLAAFDSGQYVLVLIAVIASVISAFYYLRLVKAAFIDEPVDKPAEEPASDLEGAAIKTAENTEESAEPKAQGGLSLLPTLAITLLVLFTLTFGAASGRILDWISGV